MVLKTRTAAEMRGLVTKKDVPAPAIEYGEDWEASLKEAMETEMEVQK